MSFVYYKFQYWLVGAKQNNSVRISVNGKSCISHASRMSEVRSTPGSRYSLSHRRKWELANLASKFGLASNHLGSQWIDNTRKCYILSSRLEHRYEWRKIIIWQYRPRSMEVMWIGERSGPRNEPNNNGLLTEGT